MVCYGVTVADVWFRNPGGYIRELIETKTVDVVFDRGYTRKRNIDPWAYMDTWMPPHLEHWRVLHVGDQGSSAYSGLSTAPYAVFPTWQYGADPLELLIWMIQNPAGKDPESYTVKGAQIDEIPVEGQDHIVVLTDLPNAISQRAFYEMVWRLQQDHPDVTLMIHGLYAPTMCLSMGWKMWDFDPRPEAGHGRVIMPTGKSVPHDEADPTLVRVVANIPARKLGDPKERCKFNIRSLKYAALNWDAEGFQSSGKTDSSTVDTESPTKSWKPNIIKRIPPRAEKATDMIACDICSLSSSCYVYRAGSVCTLPSSSGSELSKYFKTRDSGLIVQGLMELMEIQTTRLEKGLEWEDDEGELSPEVSKLVNSLYRQGVDLAKLVDPKLTRPMVAIQNNVTSNGASVVTSGSDQQLVAAAKAELEEAGFRADEITFGMIEEYRSTGILPQRALPDRSAVIDAVVVGDHENEG